MAGARLVSDPLDLHNFRSFRLERDERIFVDHIDRRDICRRRESDFAFHTLEFSMARNEFVVSS
jgi:hypothetical protein